MYFKDLGLDDQLLDAISYMGFEEATEVQALSMPAILEGKDILACAQTGTGKTAAFTLPILNRLIEQPSKPGIKALILAPTRELALQIDQQIQGFAYFSGLTSIAVYGGGSGEDWDIQRKALKTGVDIVVATPGKLISHLNMKYVDMQHLQTLILDEADRMLDMGFMEDLRTIIRFLPKERQNLFFSATMPPKIRKLSKEVLKDPVEINIAISKPAEGILQAAYLVYDNQKADLLKSLIADKPNYESIIIFCSTKKKVSSILSAIRKISDNTDGISSDYEQSEREKVLQRFRSKKTRILVSTDVLSRGIDIKDINLVINYDVPGDAEDYVHRVGRTARANTTGVAITFINEDDMYKFSKIEKLIERDIIKLTPPKSLGPTPEWNPKNRDKRGGGKRGKRFKKSYR